MTFMATRIENDDQLLLARTWRKSFAHALTMEVGVGDNVHPRIAQAWRDGMQSLIDSLDAEIAVYEADQPIRDRWETIAQEEPPSSARYRCRVCGRTAARPEARCSDEIGLVECSDYWKQTHTEVSA